MKLDTATPELPVADVTAAQEHYRDVFGFQIAWTHDSGELGAVSHGACAIFLRLSEAPFAPVRIWIFVDDVDAAHAAMVAAGANIAEPIEDKPWNLRQFAMLDRDGNRIVMHHDV